MGCNLRTLPIGVPMDKSIHSAEYERFLALLKKNRVANGLTQYDIAMKLNATQSFISKCERGERRLDVVELSAWCSALNMSLSAFVEQFENPSEYK